MTQLWDDARASEVGGPGGHCPSIRARRAAGEKWIAQEKEEEREEVELRGLPVELLP